mgnify:CR=1 FL=1
MENNEKEVLFSVSHLKKYFQVGNHATLKAVDDVSFDIYKGETLGMVGESGCGKTTCGRTCIGLYDKTDGQVLYKGTDVHALNGKERFAFKKQVQMVFQDPYGSLDPRMTVADIIGEGIDIHHLAKNKKERQEMIYKYLELVGLNREHANRFVHEFSGGQRQRIGIARALAVQPEFIVLDELKLAEVKTKEMKKVLDNLKVNNALVIIGDDSENVALSARNIAGVQTASVNTINVFDMLKYNTIIATKTSVASIEEVYA